MQAEDAVLERLNSVLEPSRTVTLAERGGGGAEVVVAHPDFRLLATMNPGTDHGKKELSPALSNRFTSVWVPSVRDASELRDIISSRLAIAGAGEAGRDVDMGEGRGEGVATSVAEALLRFWGFFQGQPALARTGLSVRDLLVSERVISSLRDGRLGYRGVSGVPTTRLLDPESTISGSGGKMLTQSRPQSPPQKPSFFIGNPKASVASSDVSPSSSCPLSLAVHFCSLF